LSVLNTQKLFSVSGLLLVRLPPDSMETSDRSIVFELLSKSIVDYILKKAKFFCGCWRRNDSIQPFVAVFSVRSGPVIEGVSLSANS
jgi:hypothetical protein